MPFEGSLATKGTDNIQNPIPAATLAPTPPNFQPRQASRFPRADTLVRNYEHGPSLSIEVPFPKCGTAYETKIGADLLVPFANNLQRAKI